jgi:hypothetical protein
VNIIGTTEIYKLPLSLTMMQSKLDNGCEGEGQLTQVGYLEDNVIVVQLCDTLFTKVTKGPQVIQIPRWSGKIWAKHCPVFSIKCF